MPQKKEGTMKSLAPGVPIRRLDPGAACRLYAVGADCCADPRYAARGRARGLPSTVARAVGAGWLGTNNPRNSRLNPLPSPDSAFSLKKSERPG